MASNLNKAFMRAYAKERSTAQSEPVPTQPAAVATSPIAERTPDGLLGRASGTRSMPAAELPTAAVAAGAASQVWQRIDRAHEERAPHLGTMGTRPTTAVAAASHTGSPRSLHAVAPTIVSPQAQRSAFRSMPGHQQVEDRPESLFLGSTTEVPSATFDAAKVEARRRTVADFLYAAGQVTAESTNPVPITVSAGHQPRSLPLGRVAPFSQPPAARGDSHPAHSAVPPANTGYSRGSMAANYFYQQPVTTGTTSAVRSVEHPRPQSPRESRPAEPSGFQQAGTKSPLFKTGVGPARSTVESAPDQLDFGSSGKIWRVDVPQSRQQPVSEPAQPEVAAPEIAVVAEAPEQPVVVEQEVQSAARLEEERNRLDREQAIHIAEKNLRRAAHHIFNPVWEVDSLQWSRVCDKLMLERADSMAQVAEHLKSACQAGLSTLAVTSAQRGEGRTTVACCLARLAAAHGLRVALVDIDLETTTLCLQINLEVEHDWCDWLAGEVSLEEVAVHSLEDQLTVFPLKPGDDLMEVADRRLRMVDMLTQLADSFELVIVDTSCLTSAGKVVSGLAEAGILDAAIIVADRRQNDPQRIEEAVGLMQTAGIESIGIVENFST